MSNYYSTSLGLILQNAGENSTTWGSFVNTNFQTLLEQAIVGQTTVTMANADYTLTSSQGVSNEARNAVLIIGGNNSTGNNVIVPAVPKLYIITNNLLSNGTAYFRVTGSSTSFSVANNTTVMVYCTGSNTGTAFYAVNYVPNATTATTATNLAGGIASQIPYQTGAGATSFIANGSSGQVLVSNGTSAPSWSTNILGNAATATTAATCSGNAATATNPQSGGSFLTSSNYNSTVPSLTGTGASGTWTINITGNAATVSSIAANTLPGSNVIGTVASAISATNATNATTQSAGTNNTTIATTAFVQTAIQTLYPVGSIYTSTVSTNPNTLFGFGTWVAFGAGRVMIGNGGGFSAGATGGSADATLVSHNHTATSTVTDPGHTHGLLVDNDMAGVAGGGPRPLRREFTINGQITTEVTGVTVSTSISTEGSSATNANLQPYIVVYMWNRTA